MASNHYQDRRVFVVKRPRVVVADDNQAIRESVNRLLAADFEVVATVSDGQAAFEAVEMLQPEAVVLDISIHPRTDSTSRSNSPLSPVRRGSSS